MLGDGRGTCEESGLRGSGAGGQRRKMTQRSFRGGEGACSLQAEYVFSGRLFWWGSLL